MSETTSLRLLHCDGDDADHPKRGLSARRAPTRFGDDAVEQMTKEPPTTQVVRGPR